MSKSASKNKSVLLTDEEWFRRLGEVAASIGTAEFHRQLLVLFGKCIDNDSAWIIRYSRLAPPDVLYTSGVPAEIVDFYNKKCLDVDPFSKHWRETGASGVLTLAELANTSPESIIYAKIFRPAARISDEIGMFFPTVGHCCFGLFLERERGCFSKADVQRAQLIFPALEGLHRSHLRQLFGNLRRNVSSDLDVLIKRPTLILDRHKVEVFSNGSWEQAVAADDSIGPILEMLLQSGSNRTLYTRDFLLKSDTFDRDFPIAPGGRIFVLENKRSADEGHGDYVMAAELLQSLTPRERDILFLIMKGQSTGQIAQSLELTKGTIKNCKLRIYRKADVTSERYLVKKLGRFFPSP